MYADPFTDAYPGFDPAHVGYVFTLDVPPRTTVALVTFVVKGLSEVYDPRGGYPIARQDALLFSWSDPVYTGPDKRVPAAGSEIARVTEQARALAAAPDLRGLSRLQQAQIVNWDSARGSAPPAFTVFEQSVEQLQAAMTSGQATSEDIVRDYLTRATVYDRHGPTFKALLALNPRAIADARDRDAARAAGRVLGPFHGVPIVLKDNIDTTELPTTGGALALVDHRPRVDSRVAAGMKAGGAVILGKANLDEFPFGDFGISTVGGTVGNAYDPSLSTAGSSGGSATAVATSLAALGFGTDTCNSLSNPAGFASLATIRTTRGLTSRAGVMPLNTYNDAVGPMGRSVRDIALALDLVTGADPGDPVTLEATAHAGPSFVANLGAASLKGARIGVFRQRFVGITGEREVAETMERVVKELRSAGATVVDVAVADYDDKYRVARGSAPGSLLAGWTAYLSRGAAPGDRVDDGRGAGPLGQDGAGRPAPARGRAAPGAVGPGPRGRDPRVRRPARGVQEGARRCARSPATGCAALPGQPGPPAHPRRRRRALRHRAGHVRGERRDRPAAGHRAGRLPRRPLPGRHLVPRPDVGRPRTAGDWPRLRAGHAAPAGSVDSQVTHRPA